MINFKIPELDNKAIILVIIVAVVIFYSDFSFVMAPQLKGIKELDPKIKKLKLDLDNFTRDSRLIEQSRAQSKLSIKGKKILSEEQVPALLNDISAIANKNNIRIMQVIPAKEAKGKEEKSLSDNSKFTPYSITLDISCDYHHLGAFINSLENAEEFMSVEEIDIIPDSANSLLEKAKLVLKTYVKK
ncbi:MAG: type 4a pilus biogenesis protein PilO [Candidatus Omnitrophica bacterium]|nr:type 4a pilus biogenesis protein PilO [Candidatus Omnitrophota bacterium]